MNLNITITHTVAPELVDILKNFSRGLDPLQPTATAVEPVAAAPKQKKLAAVTTGNVVEESAASNPAATTEISTETLRQKTAEIIQSGKRAEVAKLLTKYGVGKLTELPKDQYGDFYKEVVAL